MTYTITSDVYTLEISRGGSDIMSFKQGAITGVKWFRDSVHIHSIDGSHVELAFDGTNTFTYNAGAVTTAYPLYVLLKAWMSQAPSNIQVFTAGAGQTVFTTTFTLLTNTIALINGTYQSWGYSAPAGGYNTTFTAPFAGGEEVAIITF